MRTEPFDAHDAPEEHAPRGAPHLRQRGMRTEPCRYGQCDGSGWIEVEETNGARECSCRRERVAAARADRLATSIPRRYLDVDFERWPITNLDQRIVREVRKYCRRLDENLEERPRALLLRRDRQRQDQPRHVRRQGGAARAALTGDLLRAGAARAHQRDLRGPARSTPTSGCWSCSGASTSSILEDLARGEAERVAAGAALRGDQPALRGSAAAAGHGRRRQPGGARRAHRATAPARGYWRCASRCPSSTETIVSGPRRLTTFASLASAPCHLPRCAPGRGERTGADGGERQLRARSPPSCPTSSAPGGGTSSASTSSATSACASCAAAWCSTTRPSASPAISSARRRSRRSPASTSGCAT